MSNKNQKNINILDQSSISNTSILKGNEHKIENNSIKNNENSNKIFKRRNSLKSSDNNKGEELKKNLKINFNQIRRNSKSSEHQKNVNKKDSILTNSSNIPSSKRTDSIFGKSRNKRNKNKKYKKIKSLKLPFREEESIYLTEVKKKKEEPPKPKIEESQSHKYLKSKLEELKLPINLQLGIKSSIDLTNKTIQDNLLSNVNIYENKKTSIEELLPKNKKYLTINNDNQKEIVYNINKDDMHRLNNLKNDNKYIHKELSKIVENKKLIKNYSTFEKDIIGININNNKLENINMKENDLLNQFKLNKLKIQSLIEENRLINKRQLIFKYSNNKFKDINKKNNIFYRNKNLLLEIQPYYSLSEKQKLYNHQLLELNKERLKDKKNFEKNTKKSLERKIKQIELKERQNLILKKNYLKKLKDNEKEFLKKLKQRNDKILENSIKYINEKNSNKEYLFNKLKEEYENNEKKVNDKAKLLKKEPLVTKEELKELSNKINGQKKILEEGLNERKEKMKKMWRERSQTLPVYKHPIVDIIEDEEFDMMDEEEEKKNQKDVNYREKRIYKPPKVKINQKLKEIRENRNLKTTKKDLMKTEIKNKNKLLNIELINNKNAEFSKIKESHIKSMNNNKKILKPIHKKLDKPIDYLKNLIEEKNNKKNDTNDIIIQDDKIIFNNEEEKFNKKNNLNIIDQIEMAKYKCNNIDKKVCEKKEFLKLKGGYIINTKLGDEVGNLLIKSAQSKLNIIKKLNGN